MESNHCPPISSGLQESPGQGVSPVTPRLPWRLTGCRSIGSGGLGSPGVPAAGASVQVFSSEVQAQAQAPPEDRVPTAHPAGRLGGLALLRVATLPAALSVPRGSDEQGAAWPSSEQATVVS